MNVVIINRELNRDRQYQIMYQSGCRYNHVIPGNLFTLEEAKEKCKKMNLNIINIGNIWECLK